MKSRIMYIERKAGELTSYRGKSFQRIRGFKANYCEMESGEDYWISGCHRDDSDRLYGERVPVEIDEDAREEYWAQMRGMPEKVGQKAA